MKTDEQLPFQGKWILVTGTSSGLGREMARQLAVLHGANIIAVARREKELESLKGELEKSAGVRVHTIAADLTRLDEVDRVLRESVDGRELQGAILNAGVTHFGEHHQLEWTGFERMLALNVTSVVRMSSFLIPYFQKNGIRGGLMFVSSIAGLTPIPYQTAYSATKAFLVHYGAGLAYEVQSSGISVTVFAPGGIETAMTSGEQFHSLKSWLTPLDKAAAEAVRAFQRRSFIYVPGFWNHLGSKLMHLLPRRFLARKLGGIYGRALSLPSTPVPIPEKPQNSSMVAPRK